MQAVIRTMILLYLRLQSEPEPRHGYVIYIISNYSYPSQSVSPNTL